MELHNLLSESALTEHRTRQLFIVNVTYRMNAFPKSSFCHWCAATLGGFVIVTRPRLLIDSFDRIPCRVGRDVKYLRCSQPFATRLHHFRRVVYGDVQNFLPWPPRGMGTRVEVERV